MGRPSVNSIQSLACVVSKCSTFRTGSRRGMAMFSARGSGARSMAESSVRRASFTAVVLASSQPSTMSSMFAVRSIS